ncbi:MAG: 50S ribosomal protein L21e [Candidatus Parvarchaeota archaeon]|nr:50S ribosomal protein L21e [Candidatus Parvarchaeota archaeon]
MKRSRGLHNSSRNRLLRDGKKTVPIGRFLQTFNVNDSVIVSPEPYFQRNIPYRRFFGASGKIVKEKGKAYTVEIKAGKKYKYIDVLPVHLKRL